MKDERLRKREELGTKKGGGGRGQKSKTLRRRIGALKPSGCGTAPPQHQRGDNANAQKADDLNEHVAGGVNTREAIPVPIRNVGRDTGEYSGSQHEAASAAETRDACLVEEEHDEDRFEQFGAKSHSEPFANRERATVRMIH